MKSFNYWLASVAAALILALIIYPARAKNLIAMSNTTYIQLWEKADSLKQAGLPKSSLEVVEQIRKISESEKNQQQFVKTIVYSMALSAGFEEDYFEKSIALLDREIARADMPAFSLLNSLQGELLFNYFISNQYQILQRTVIKGDPGADIKTWDADAVLQKARFHHLQSIKDSDELKKTSAGFFDEVLETQENSRILRPTLFDLLAHRALDFFMNPQSSLTSAYDPVQLNDPRFFLSSQEFANLITEQPSAPSSNFQTLEILRQLSGFHLSNLESPAIVDVELKRLFWLRNQSTHHEKEQMYMQALERMEQQFSGSPAMPEIVLAIANELQRQGNTYDPFINSENRLRLQEAVEKLEKVIAAFPDQPATQNCKNLLAQIKLPSVQIQVDNVQIPGQAFKGLVSFKNIPELHLRLIAIDHEKDLELRNEYRQVEDLLAAYLKLPAYKTWRQEIPDDGDFQSHNVEIPFQALPAGYYVLIAGYNERFTRSKNLFPYTTFWVSNLAFVNRRQSDGSIEYLVTDRRTGTPLRNVKATAYTREHNPSHRRVEMKKWKEYTTSRDGTFTIPAPEARSASANFTIVLKRKKDQFATGNFFSQQRFSTERRQRTQTFFFTDRSLYRPGQTVHFKGIVIDTDGETSSVKTDHPTTVALMDANRRKVSEIRLQTNEYGSFSGSFTLPSSGLSGNFSISNENGTTYFSVEEYKLPAFEVSFDTLKDSYKLGQELTIRGQARAYAGYPVTGAAVQYRITRQIYYPFLRFRPWMVMPAFPAVEIISGTALTDDNGNFTIVFTATPDHSVNMERNPAFIFNVTADVTDINGETQSGAMAVSVGQKALILGVDLTESINKDSFTGFQVKAENLNGFAQPADVEVVVSKLSQPLRPLRSRLYSRPDRFVMTADEHRRLFPDDIYDDENSPENWTVERSVHKTSINTGNQTLLIPADFRQWEAGVYVIELKSRDAFGENVEFRQHFTLFAPGNKKPPVNELWWSNVLTPTAQPGEKARVMIASATRLSVLFEVELNGEIISRQRIRLNGDSRILEIPVTEKHYGDFRVMFTAVFNNRVFVENHNILVPDHRKKLNIKLETKRNRLEPGAAEEWTVLIADHLHQPAVAEMLAAMYDASLDAIKPHNWNFNIYTIRPRQFNWETSDAFSLRAALGRFHIDRQKYFTRQYDQINWFGFPVYGMPIYGVGFRDAEHSPMMMKAEAAPGARVMAVEDAGDKMENVVQDDAAANQAAMPAMLVRRDFRETAFFYPKLISSETGEVKLQFRMPESLTRWRLMGFAHTPELKTGSLEAFFEASREVMIVSNAPRFLRQGDQIEFKAKVVNTSEADLNALVRLELFDAITLEPVHQVYNISGGELSVSLPAKNARDVSWQLNVPASGPYAVLYRLTAVAGNHSDGEENILPVLTNSQLLTESLPLFASSGETRNFSLAKLRQTDGRKDAHHQLTLEFTTNPVWYVVQALPYLAQPEFRNTSAIFTQYYANALAQKIVNTHPEIERVFEVWQKTDHGALLSNLEKNEDLKSILISETPWINDAMQESERKRQLALHFDRNHINNQLQQSISRLSAMQLGDGSWPWFPGMTGNRHITLQILGGFGKLQHLKAINIDETGDLMRRLQMAIRYLDEQMVSDYKELHRAGKTGLNSLDAGVAYYLYSRSFWIDRFPLMSGYDEISAFWKNQAVQHWNTQPLQVQGMIALALHRMGETATARQIMQSVDDRALKNDEMGMYWRDLRPGFAWYMAPVETQAMLIEAYATVFKDQQAVEKMQQWLIKQKQTRAWKTNSATADAVYAILMRGNQSLAPNRGFSVSIGNMTIDPENDPEIRTEAGSGYFRKSWNRSEISSEMANITVVNNGNSIVWGGLYWQYFEQLDRITPHETPLKISRRLMREVITPTGPVLEEIGVASPLKIGDKLVMRIELRVDRDMEYVHMKDLRAPAFEPIEQLSGYKFQGGLGYYESPRDAATHFFFQYLPRGTWVFEYKMLVSQAGDFSTGITTIQSLYAPEFTSHSEGFRVKTTE